MRWRCFWPEVKMSFFKKVRTVFRALAKINDATFKNTYTGSEDKWYALLFTRESQWNMEEKFVDQKKFNEKKLKKYFSLKIQNIVLVLKRIQRRASNSLSKCSNVSIAYFPPNLSRPFRDLDPHLVTCSDIRYTFSQFVIEKSLSERTYCMKN